MNEMDLTDKIGKGCVTKQGDGANQEYGANLEDATDRGSAIGPEGEILLSGTVILGDEFEPVDGYLCIEKGIIKEIGCEKVETELEGIICPSFVNAHTHLGDSVIKDPPFMPLSELVGPKGLKHQVLETTSRSKLVEGMRTSLRDMRATGTCAFADFREGGPSGVDMLLEALESIPLIARTFGRPNPGSFEIHPRCWGVGISSTRDYTFALVDAIVNAARAHNRKVAFHAGESSRDDIEPALEFEPDHLVHLTQATSEDLKKVADSSVPVVICPRSNLVTGVGLPKVAQMLERGIVVGLGTDNVMLNSPNMFSEMKLASKALAHNDRQVFKMCTLNGAQILGIEDRVGSIKVGKEGRLMIIDGRSDNLWGVKDPLASVVRRARPSDIMAVF